MFLSVLFYRKSLIVKGIGEEVIGCPYFSQSAVFLMTPTTKIDPLNQGFFRLHEVKYKTLTQASHIYIQLHNSNFYVSNLGDV